MSTKTAELPITETLTPANETEVAEIVRSCSDSGTAIYPWGGRTSLNQGLPAKTDGIGLATTGLNSIVDYPARDMTITVGAGITMNELREALAAESQQLPVDCAASDRATLGGVIATNHSGPRRYGHGTMRDYVIGIRAVNGLGEAFAAGGRVVKNVAGYDFCKLLTGSMGTLGIITEVTLKLKPLPPAGAWMICQPRDAVHAEQVLARLVESATTPNLIELISGDCWQNVPRVTGLETQAIVVGFEGSVTQVDWMTEQLASEWKEVGLESTKVTDPQAADELYRHLTEFSSDEEAAMVVKLTVLPSAVTRTVEQLRRIEPKVAVQAHAGNGIVIAKFADYPGSTSPMKAIAAASKGTATILSNPSGAEMTHHNVWGAADVPFDIMQRVKQAFDPNNILNPGRFVY